MTETITQFISDNRVLAVTAVILLALVYVPPARAASKLILRLAARLMLVVALIALVSDGTRSIANDSGIVITSALDYWAELAPTSLETVKRTLSVKVHPAVWDAGLARLLALPAWLVLGGGAVIILYLARKRRQATIFANA
jgi:hypothetical protein